MMAAGGDRPGAGGDRPEAGGDRPDDVGDHPPGRVNAAGVGPSLASAPDLQHTPRTAVMPEGGWAPRRRSHPGLARYCGEPALRRTSAAGEAASLQMVAATVVVAAAMGANSHRCPRPHSARHGCPCHGCPYQHPFACSVRTGHPCHHPSAGQSPGAGEAPQEGLPVWCLGASSRCSPCQIGGLDQHNDILASYLDSTKE
mmetsp:Transcript_62352/g.134114  ORF Transcript_62352/g.134114 Transcript_62352/m.134114 type:complete len:200 (-) Transcript_62352:144-743(-)